ncbi:MAG: SDR family NAD(P)-dependent oxidoreductase [Alphaproteobacteria bacterium]
MADERKSVRLDGKVALITGAGAGMGREHALLLAARGARIAVQDIDTDGARETVRRVTAAGGAAMAFASDVAKVGAIQQTVRDVESTWGRIDILINNAGIHERRPFEEIEEAHFQRMFDIHVKGAFFATQATVPGMKARKSGKIINISSTAGMTGTLGDVHYCGAKAALLGLTKAWAKELAPWNIHVNAICPGPIATEMAVRNRGWEGIRERAEKEIPLRRYGDPVDVSHAVGFLASSESDFITGQALPIAGGLAIVGI